MEQRDFAKLMEHYGDGGARKSVFDGDYAMFLESKWESALNGIKAPYHRRITAMVMENQLDEMRRAKSLREDSTSGNTGAYTKHIFQVLRKLFPGLIAHNIITVQPMSGPIGAVFFWDYKHGTNKGSMAAGQTLPDNMSPYYSSEYIDGEQLGTGDGAKWGGGGAAATFQLSFYPVRPLNNTYGYSVRLIEETPLGVAVQTAIDNGTGGYTGNVLSGAVSYTSGAVTNFKFTNPVGLNNVVKAYYRYNMELNSILPEVNWDISMEAVKAEPRKLRFKWSPEAVEALQAYHGMSGESELVAGIAQQMMYEIDREIITDLSTFAASGTTATFDYSVPVAAVNTLDALRRIFLPLNDVSSAIHRKTKRGAANFMVTSPQVVGLLEQFQTHGDYRGIFTPDVNNLSQIDYTQVSPTYNTMTSNMGVVRAGTLNKKWTIYQDPQMTYNRVLMGFKGDSWMDAGYAWCPWISMQMTNTFEDPQDFSMKKGIRCQYGLKRLRPEWYGLVTITNWASV